MKNEPKLELLCEYFATLKPPVVVGSGPYGMRQIFDVTGGEVTGPRLRWRVQPERFRTLVLAVLVITGIGVIVSASGVLG